MSKTLTHEAAADETIDYKAATVECIKKVGNMLAEIKERQANTERLHKETQEALDRLKAA